MTSTRCLQAISCHASATKPLKGLIVCFGTISDVVMQLSSHSVERKSWCSSCQGCSRNTVLSIALNEKSATGLLLPLPHHPQAVFLVIITNPCSPTESQKAHRPQEPGNTSPRSDRSGFALQEVKPTLLSSAEIDDTVSNPLSMEPQPVEHKTLHIIRPMNLLPPRRSRIVTMSPFTLCVRRLR